MAEERTYVRMIPLTTYDTSGLTGTYASMNGTGMEAPVKLLKMYNASNVLVTISLDGVDDHDVIPAGGTFVMDVQTNSHGWGGSNGHWEWRDKQIFYGKGSAGTGNLYIMGYY